jgi:hypothetical protein
VLYPAVSAALNGVLRANGGAVWAAPWRAVVVRSIIVPQALALFDAETTAFGGSWAVLDDEPARVAAALKDATVTELLLQRVTTVSRFLFKLFTQPPYGSQRSE